MSSEVEVGDYWFDPQQIFVSVKTSEINTNNITSKAPYTITEITGEPYVFFLSFLLVLLTLVMAHKRRPENLNYCHLSIALI